MLEDVVNRLAAEQLSIEDISDSLMSPILDFYNKGDLLAETLLSSEASTSSQGAAEDFYNTTTFSSFPTMDSLAQLENSLQDENSEVPSVIENYDNPSFMNSTGQRYICEQQQKHQNCDDIICTYPETLESIMQLQASLLQPQQSSTLSAIYEESPAQLPTSYMSFNPSQTCSFMDSNSFYTTSGDSTGLFVGGMMVGVDTGITPQELVQSQMSDNGGAGAYTMDSNTAYCYPNEMIGDNQQYLTGTSCTINAPMGSAEAPAVDDQTFKVGKLSTEQRREKINRYMKKRSERNFSKKIKYACRKTLADSRPRVRGRFAKNDDLGDTARPSSGQHGYEDYEIAMKEEGLLDSSDILAQISGLNSFKYNYTLESWI